MSLDIAPDGRTIVFDLLGDLYIVPITGGDAARLTGGMAFDAQPRYSPDGSRIVFVSDRNGESNLWLVNGDGSHPRILTRERRATFTSPTWSPDGRHVLVSRKKPFFKASSYELWMYDVRGGSGIPVTGNRTHIEESGPAPRQALGAVASHDGRYFYYAQRTGHAEWNADLPLWQVARLDRNSGQEDVLTAAHGSGMRPLLSPDGRSLVYATRLDARTGLRIRDLRSGEERWLAYPVQRDDQESFPPQADLMPGYAFTPDGNSVVAAYGGKIHRIRVAGASNQLIHFTAAVTQELGPNLYVASRVEDGPGVRARLIQGAEQSPDGERIVFSALARLYVAPFSGGPPRRLTTGDSREYQPAWSPDGRWIAYVTWGKQGGQVLKVRSGGQGTPMPLTPLGPYYRDPAWSPDGRHVVALRAPRRERQELATVRDYADSYTTRSLELVYVSASGGTPVLITLARGGWRPHFAGGPERIYLFSADGVISVRLDGMDARKHLILTAPDLWGTADPVPLPRVVLAPDGRHALALYRQQLFVFGVPPPVGAPVTVDLDTPAVPLARVSLAGADHFAWADHGATITWSRGSTFFRQSVASLLGERKPLQRSASRRDSTTVVVSLPRDRPHGTVVLRGSRVVTMRGDEVIPDADVVVRGNRIASIGPRGRTPLAGARIINVSGATIIPGMIDTHAHWIVQTGVLDPQPWPLLINLAYGVTTGRDVQTQESDMFAYQDLIDAGEMLGPRAFSTGPGIFWTTDISSADEAIEIVTKYRNDFRTTMVKSYQVGSRRQRQLLVQASRRLGMMPTAEGGGDLMMDLTHAIDGFSGNEHNLPVVPLYGDVVELMARSGITYSQTLTTAHGGRFGEFYFEIEEDIHDDPKVRRFTPHWIVDERSRRQWTRPDEYHLPQVAKGGTQILRAGGTVTLGSHGNNQGIGYHWNVWAMALGEATPMETLRAATLNGARALGYEQDLGSLEPGKLADLIVLDKNPLEDIRNTNSIRYVMKNGRLYQGNDLTEIWPRRKTLPPTYRWDTAFPADPAGEKGQ